MNGGLALRETVSALPNVRMAGNQMRGAWKKTVEPGDRE